MNIILSLIIACTIALGAPVQASQEASQGPSQAATGAVCTEDMDCWDSATMGQDLPRLTDNEIDAWESISSLSIYPASPEQSLDYTETLDHKPATLPLGYFAVASKTQPNTYHVMQWVTLSYA